MTYADYEFYTGEYMGAILQADEFDRLALRASEFIDYYTMGKATEIEPVKMACCALAEQYKIIEAAQISAYDAALENAHELKSQSVGDWSQAYTTAADNAKMFAASYVEATNRLPEIMTRYLGRTGLLYRGRCR